MLSVYIITLLINLISVSIEQIEIDLIPSSIYRKEFETTIDGIFNIKSKQEQDALLLIPVKLGSPSQLFHLLIDTNTYPIWVQDSNSKSNIPLQQKTFNKQLSSTFKNTNKSFSFTYSSNKCTGEFISETIDIGALSTQIDIPIVTEYSSYLWGIDGIIGLSHSVSDEDKDQFTILNSLIPLLAGLNYTEKNMFSLQSFNQSHPKMYIGKKHDDFILKKDNVISCDTSHISNGHWGCMTNMIIYNDTGIRINREVVIDSTVEQVYIPIDLMPIFKKKIISKENCIEKENKKGYYFICNSLEDWLPFALVFNETILKFPNDMLVSQYNSHKFHLINIIFSDKYDEIRLGTSLFRSYHVLFDNEDNRISFYSIDKVNVGYLKNYQSIVIYKGYSDHLYILFLLNLLIVSMYIIFKVVKYQIRKYKIKQYPTEIFEEFRLSQIK